MFMRPLTVNQINLHFFKDNCPIIHPNTCILIYIIEGGGGDESASIAPFA